MSPVFAGIDLGGASVKTALSDGDGSVLVQSAIPTASHEGPERVIERLHEQIAELQAKLGSETHVAAIGMGVPGLVDVSTGQTKFLPNLPTQWRNVPVADWLSSRWSCPVRLLNDVRTATLGELRFGHGRGRPRMTLAFFSIGTGIGGGVAIDGQLRLGPLGAAGELGHQTLLPEGPRCGCGNRGCLEALASGPAITAEGARLMLAGLAPKLHELVGGSVDRITPREMATASSTDAAVHEALTRAATWIGIAAANVVSTLHPDLVVLGGGVAEMGELLTATVRDTISDRVRMFPTDDLQVAQSQLGVDAGVLGAIALASDAYRAPHGEHAT